MFDQYIYYKHRTKELTSNVDDSYSLLLSGLESKSRMSTEKDVDLGIEKTMVKFDDLPDRVRGDEFGYGQNYIPTKDDEWFLCINRKYSYDAFMQYAFSQVSEKLIQNYVDLWCSGWDRLTLTYNVDDYSGEIIETTNLHPYIISQKLKGQDGSQDTFKKTIRNLMNNMEFSKIHELYLKISECIEKDSTHRTSIHKKFMYSITAKYYAMTD